MRRPKSRSTSILFFILALILFFLVGPAFSAAIFAILWNWIVPMFWEAAPVINFWTAWGVTILLNLVFGRVKTNS